MVQTSYARATGDKTPLLASDAFIAGLAEIAEIAEVAEKSARAGA